jgi:phospholipase D1/2
MPRSILRQHRNVWRIERAARAAVLVDGAALFRAVRESLIKAKRSILIVGWDIDSRTRLVGESGEVNDGHPVALAEFLSALVERRPELTIRLLLWDYSMLYSLERELLPQLALNWSTPDQVQLCLDNEAPLGCSQHQKIIVADDAVAFSGGLDLTVRRWDTPEHSFDNPHRVDPAGKPYPPFHDVQAVVDGAAAAALAELARARWCAASKANVSPTKADGDCWPASVAPDFTNVAIGISRTQPCEGKRGIREVEQLFLDSIDAADRTIYIENQFLTSEPIARRLAQRMRRKRKLETVIVAPNRPEAWFEAHTMRNGRIRFRRILEQAGVGDRWRLVCPEVRNGDQTTHTMIHSKVMVVDDRLLRVGSANMNHRSMGADTECDLVIEANSKTEADAIVRIRNQLLGEHCGSTAADVEELLDNTGSLVAVADILCRNGHCLRPIDDGEPDAGDMAAYIEAVADPRRPMNLSSLVTAMRGKLAALSSLVTIVIAIGMLLMLVAAWRYSPLSEYATPEVVRSSLKDFSTSFWGPLLVLAFFLGGGLIAFPVTVLIAATAATFGPWLGFLYAAIGAMASALVTYGIGALLGREVLRQWLGPRLTQIRQRIVRQGVLAVAAIRVVPVAPFTLVNLVAGASGIRLFDYTAGTLLGLLPGLIALAILGHQFMRIIAAPTVFEVALLAACIAVWLALSAAVQIAITRLGAARVES